MIVSSPFFSYILSQIIMHLIGSPNPFIITVCSQKKVYCLRNIVWTRQMNGSGVPPPGTVGKQQAAGIYTRASNEPLRKLNKVLQSRFSWLKAPTIAHSHLRHFSKQAPKHSK